MARTAQSYAYESESGVVLVTETAEAPHLK